MLQDRPHPYIGTYLLLSLESQSAAKLLLDKLTQVVTSANDWAHPSEGAWVNVAFTYEGLRQIGIPNASLESFDPLFIQGMAARAHHLGDRGESAAEHWEAPFGTDQIHVAFALFASNEIALDTAREAAKQAYHEIGGISVQYHMDVGMMPDGRTHLGFRDGISNPYIDGSPFPPAFGHEGPVKSGEFLFGYPNESGQIMEGPSPAPLGHNGSYLSLRKLHICAAAYRRYVQEKATASLSAERIGAKMVGRWPSGTPLALSPEEDDTRLSEDESRINVFSYADDPKGFKCPISAHVRRAFPRDSLQDQVVDVNIHRLLRRSTVYGPALTKGVLEDDGHDRGIIFAGICTSLIRQYEFIKTEWLNGGNFVGLSTEQDPVTGNKDGEHTFTIPAKPLRHRLKEVPEFSITRGGEYFFIPSLTALRWLAEQAGQGPSDL
ncbi:Dyp-type peroxidase [Paenibacillus shirakamiensis]|uniref:Dyp-type peroxidase n=1 Tax=Paenibacillus shirakamiensis TaxID=1265935 RepID=UPI00315AFC53